MSQFEPTTSLGATPSPCVGKCILNDHQVCTGCFRSRSEIGSWSMVADPEKRRIVERAETRRLKMDL
ncbi:hypothetical protein CA13_44990 [Planctomycetes bacterium CA13]|uniref:Fe-S protein n=1 Tax=Novipirellula herctigrandis TaxID=2527986 RepID=A0A5C5Z7J7_9BACT|nr:hypothetical protein CA13_44990 [Planctomycetes bacterium CA13]